MNDQPRDGMPRAYLRIDPNLDQTHPDPLGMLLVLCAAARQPERGRFRDRALLVRAVGARRAQRFLERGDVVMLPDGRFYVDGWDEWQEGDWTVAERMKRMRARRAATKRASNGASVSAVTVPASQPSNDVTTDAGIDNPPSDYLSGDGDGGDARAPAREDDRATAVIDYIEKRSGRAFTSAPGSKVMAALAADVRDFGETRFIEAMESIRTEHPDVAQLVFGASRKLHPIAGSKNGDNRFLEHDATEAENAFQR